MRVAKTKTTTEKTAAWRFYADRDDLRFATRVAAWKADLADLGADAGHLPFLRALTKKGNLQLGRAHATIRGLRLSGHTINTIIKTRADALTGAQQDDVFEAVPLYGQWPAPDGRTTPGPDAAEDRAAPDRSHGGLGRGGGHLVDRPAVGVGE